MNVAAMHVEKDIETDDRMHDTNEPIRKRRRIEEHDTSTRKRIKFTDNTGDRMTDPVSDLAEWVDYIVELIRCRMEFVQSHGMRAFMVKEQELASFPKMHGYGYSIKVLQQVLMHRGFYVQSVAHGLMIHT
jgi:hypothetical protein